MTPPCLPKFLRNLGRVVLTPILVYIILCGPFIFPHFGFKMGEGREGVKPQRIFNDSSQTIHL